MTEGYRNALAAAHERIADLEAKLAGRDAPSSEEAPPPFRRRWRPPGWHVAVSVALGVGGTVGIVVLSGSSDGVPPLKMIAACTVLIVVGSTYGAWASTR